MSMELEENRGIYTKAHKIIIMWTDIRNRYSVVPPCTLGFVLQDYPIFKFVEYNKDA